ncbi:MAG TPA: TonB-dependent receptor [Thermoanaerobaculia bacterium]|nr:TonB-dependent receptor [Thermoanaerobaculia bacterium]
MVSNGASRLSPLRGAGHCLALAALVVLTSAAPRLAGAQTAPGDAQQAEPQPSPTPPPEQAATGQPPAEEQLPGFGEEITVTGTRVSGRSATDTPAPVDYIAPEAIQSTGATETGKILQLLEPSFNFSTTTISDGTDIVRPATLRGLGSDQLLVLVNGKRRHQQSLVNVQQTVARGSAGYDVNAIPASAIDHIEVLRDGAAAQYGSDAIAGVINIILKDQTASTDVQLEGGQHYAGDGELFMGGVNSGFAIGSDGFVNITGEYRDRGETNRAGPDLLRPSGPDQQTGHVTQRIGDAEAKDALLWINSEIGAGPGRFYAFGGWSDRKGNSSGFFRTKGDNRTVPAIYPNGFLPTIITEPIDTSLVLGYRGDLGTDWKYDFAASWGQSKFKFREENTVNVTWFYEPTNPSNPTGPRFNASPTSADTGTLTLDQLVYTLDLTGILNWGMGSGPLYLATGVEWRDDGYKIEAGDPVSYAYGRTDNRAIRILGQTGDIAQPGTQGFPGWSPREAIDKSRNNKAVYVDAESQLTKSFLGGAALRFEDYSDFGNTVTGKLSGRFEVTDTLALRGTVSNGFRAPGVQQEFYSQRSTNLNAAGVLTDTLTALQGGAVTRAFGIPKLKEETSRNYSVGLVSKPSDNFRVTFDFYRVDIKDRIVFSSNIDPSFGPQVASLLDQLGVGQVLFFTNAIDTKSTGADLVLLYDWKLPSDRLLAFEGAFSLNKTEVTDRHSSSSILPANKLFDDTQVTLIEHGQPRQHHVVSSTYYQGPFKANLRLNYFGSVQGQGFTPGLIQTWKAKTLTDVTFTYSLRNNLDVSLGGLNVFNVYPTKWDEVNGFPFPQLGFTYGWETLPFGINGGYYFLRMSYRFNHS